MARIVFMGTPDFAVAPLNALLTHHEVVGIVTQPDRPAGRKGALKAPPVKEIALAHNIPFIQPEKLRQTDAQAWLRDIHADLFVVAAFGQLLPKSVLEMPKVACINVHGSLLPRWRGAAPIQAAIRAGDTETGVTIMLMDVGLDTGAMLSKRAFPILPTDTSATIFPHMAQVGADLLIETIPRYLAGSITPQTQDETQVTFAPQIEKADGLIHWAEDAYAIERHIRAFTPWPGTFTRWNGATLRIFVANVVDGSAPVGQVVVYERGYAVGTGNSLLVLGDVQLESKKRMPIADFVRGYPQFVGTVLA